MDFSVPSQPPCDRRLAAYTFQCEGPSSNFEIMMCLSDGVFRFQFITRWRCDDWSQVEAVGLPLLLLLLIDLLNGSSNPQHMIYFHVTLIMIFFAWPTISYGGRDSYPPPFRITFLVII